MTPNKNKPLELIPEGDYEVCIVSVEARVSKFTGKGFTLCKCIIQDEAPFKDRLIFYAYTPSRYNTDMHPEINKCIQTGSEWTHRYASAKVSIWSPIGDPQIRHNTIKRLLLI